MTEGIRTLISHHSVDETIARLQTSLQQKNVKLFCIIDHSGEAASAGLAMRPTKVLIFGSPKAGTPLMIAAPSLALDLPLKILIAENEAGEVVVSWNDPAWLQQRHSFPPELVANLAAIEAFAKAAAA
ncbi:MAG TPA: DUF302 domain-containing protein [Acidobacteriaceae bacterium]